MICLQTPSFGWSFQDGRQSASKPVHHNELLDPVLFLRSVILLPSYVYNMHGDTKSARLIAVYKRSLTKSLFLQSALRLSSARTTKLPDWVSTGQSGFHLARKAVWSWSIITMTLTKCLEPWKCCGNARNFGSHKVTHKRRPDVDDYPYLSKKYFVKKSDEWPIVHLMRFKTLW